MRLVVGLGNPGSRYEKTRHNLGFMVVDALASELGAPVSKRQGKALVGMGLVAGQRLLLAKPQCYMNNSGEAVWELLHYYRDRLEDLIIVHDDLDLSYGRIRFRSGGGTGGHKGLKSISQHLNSLDFDRARIGIGRPPALMPVEEYVLSPFSLEEKGRLPDIIRGVVEGLKVWALHGIEKAMNEYNGIKFIPDEGSGKNASLEGD